MGFTLCTNGSCPKACWCKRFTYNMGERRGPRDTYTYADFSEKCNPTNEYQYYVRNKAREIYERENINDTPDDEEFDTEEYEDYNREPGVREDDQTYSRAKEILESRHESLKNCILQFLDICHRRGIDPSDVCDTKRGGEEIKLLPDSSLDSVYSAGLESGTIDDRISLQAIKRLALHPPNRNAMDIG